MTDGPAERAGDPANQFLAPEKVIGELAREGARRAAGLLRRSGSATGNGPWWWWLPSSRSWCSPRA